MDRRPGSGDLDADGGLRMEHPLADVSWAVWRVWQYRPDAGLLEQPALRDVIAARLAGLSDGRA
jgi:hypothetical protein